MKPRLYLIPGMGCDARLFTDLHEHLDFTVLEFLQPEEGETLQHYAERMAKGIDMSAPWFIGGVSFGGMIATEIARQHDVQGVIYISSLKCRRELPTWLRVFRRLPMHKMLSGKSLKMLWPKSPFPRSQRHKDIMLAMKNDSDPTLFKWSVSQAAAFSNKVPPRRYIHLHGTKDLLLPGMFVRGAIKIRGGDHGMVMAHAREIARLVGEWMDGLPGDGNG